MTTASHVLALPQEMLLCGSKNLLDSWLNKLTYQQKEIVLCNMHYLEHTILGEESQQDSACSLRPAKLESTKRSRNETRGGTV